MAHFPNTLSFTGFNTPSRIEADILGLVHQGTIPEGLNGAFYRVQPDPQFPPRLGDDISFNGDASGNCTSLAINNFSYVGPMTP